MIKSINFHSVYNYASLNFSNQPSIKREKNFHIKQINDNITQVNNPAYRGKEFDINPKILGLYENISNQPIKEFNSFMKANELKDPNKIEKSPLKNLGVTYDKWDIGIERIKMMNFVSYAKDFHLDFNTIKKALAFQKEFNELTSEDLSLNELKLNILILNKDTMNL